MLKNQKRERLSIDIFPEQHRRIKAYAALKGTTIRDCVMESINEYLAKEEENNDLFLMTTTPTSVLQKVWDNEEDAVYDNL
jgi:uncharacterized protein (DUF1778 family)